jgi:hypothetical protein
MEKRNINFRIDQSLFLATKTENVFKKRKEKISPVLMLNGIFSFLFFNPSAKQEKKSNKTKILTEAKSTPSVGLSAI